jgi:hypothetical protein
MSNENPGGDLGNGELPQGQLSPAQLESNRQLVLARMERRFGLDDAAITNPTLQHSLQRPEEHGF